MGILKKKIRATTLMETIVATSIILMVFVIASLVLNNTFRTLTLRDTFSVQNRLETLQYLYVHEKFTLPYYESFEEYEISIERTSEDNIHYIIYEASKEQQKTPLTIQTIDETTPQ
ncbi:hypothetical protein [Dokdonia sp.]|uniref:hypothetical protein n=1 Tax=Dokdonia sp. TaxID=2024995 RepID=UPI003267EEA3